MRHERLAAPDGRVVTVPGGFSFAACLLPPLWMIYHRLWLHLAVWILGAIAAFFGIVCLALEAMGPGPWLWMAQVFACLSIGCLTLIPGALGNRWRIRRLKRLGFKPLGDGD